MSTTTATQTEPTRTKLELRTAYGSVYRDVSTAAPRECHADEIPLIDLAPLYGDTAARKALAKQIGHAATNTGFFYVKNHGIDEAIIDAALKQAKSFFAQPEDKKQLVSKSKSKYFNGWSAKRSAHVSPSESLGSFRCTPFLSSL